MTLNENAAPTGDSTDYTRFGAVGFNLALDNPRVLCQDCNRALFRWFLSKPIDWRLVRGY